MKLVPYALYDCTNSNFVESKKKILMIFWNVVLRILATPFINNPRMPYVFLNFALKYEQDMHFISILIIYL